MQATSSISINNNPVSALGGTFANEKSIELDGVDEYVQTDANYTVLNGATKATFSFWMKMDTLPLTTNAVLKIGSQVGIWIRNTGWMRFFMTTGSYYADTSVGSIVTGTWQHIFICINLPLTSEAAIFVNGVNVYNNDNLGTRSAFNNNASPLQLGYESVSNDKFFKGHFKDFAIFSGSDLQAEAADYYNGGVPTDLVNDHVTPPSTWHRLGDGADDTYAVLKDVMGVSDASGINTEDGDIVEDSP